MPTLNQYRFEILETINQTSSDSSIDYRLLDFWISSKRTAWFTKLYNKFQSTVPNVYYQTLPCVEVIDVDQSECCEISTGCSIKRTKEKLPEFLALADGELIEKVGPTFIVTIPFSVINYKRAEFFGNGRFDKNSIGVFLYNGYLYLISKDTFHLNMLEYINVRGVFRDPLQAGEFKDCDNQPCFSAESEYPLEARLWEFIKMEILTKEIPLKLGTKADSRGDNQDNAIDDTPIG
jgi:hypothetical protein